MEDRCVVCDAPVPEGRHVCGQCDKNDGSYGGAIYEPQKEDKKTILQIIKELLKKQE